MSIPPKIQQKNLSEEVMPQVTIFNEVDLLLHSLLPYSTLYFVINHVHIHGFPLSITRAFAHLQINNFVRTQHAQIP